jgi:hypothetical protein
MANIYFYYFIIFPKKLFVEFALVFLFVATLPEFAKITKPGPTKPGPSSGDASERFPSGQSPARAREGGGAREGERDGEREREMEEKRREEKDAVVTRMRL